LESASYFRESEFSAEKVIFKKNRVIKPTEKRPGLEGNQITPYALGKSGENAALRFLEEKKYKIVTKNFRLFRGEIDIVAYDKRTLVFIEVKTRRSTDFGLPEESVTLSKQKQIKKIAQGFLTKNNLHEIECRFDVVSLTLDEGIGYSIRHIKNAF
jgi:putative endonuclease